jgi:hypothetical protein
MKELLTNGDIARLSLLRRCRLVRPISSAYGTRDLRPSLLGVTLHTGGVPPLDAPIGSHRSHPFPISIQASSPIGSRLRVLQMFFASKASARDLLEFGRRYPSKFKHTPAVPFAIPFRSPIHNGQLESYANPIVRISRVPRLGIR